MSIPNLIPHKTLYISGYIYSYYAFVFIFEFPEHISKHILQFHASSTLGKVVVSEKPFNHMLNNNKSWTGIRVVRMSHSKNN